MPITKKRTEEKKRPHRDTLSSYRIRPSFLQLQEFAYCPPFEKVFKTKKPRDLPLLWKVKTFVAYGTTGNLILGMLSQATAPSDVKPLPE
jgi:hypothetical protein